MVKLEEVLLGKEVLEAVDIRVTYCESGVAGMLLDAMMLAQ